MYDLMNILKLLGSIIRKIKGNILTNTNVN